MEPGTGAGGVGQEEEAEWAQETLQEEDDDALERSRLVKSC